MTVTDRPVPASAADLVDLFPTGSHLDRDGELVVGGCRLTDLAERFGTPAVIVDEAALRARAREYVRALAAHWPNGQAVFASKAFPCTAVIRVLTEEGLGVDVAGGGELAAALAAGADPARIVVHGNAKTDEELTMAVEAGAGTIVVDNNDDIDRLERLVPAGAEQRVLLRVIPEVEADTHAAMATGHRGAKFGLAVPDAVRAAARLRASDRLRLEGLHAHVGSQLLETAPFTRAVEALGALGELGEHAVYDLGGGLGVRYTYDDAPPSVEEYVRALTDAARAQLPDTARLIIEPGRSLVAGAALTLYRAVTVKPGPRTLVAVDGGMGDNLEPMLYGQRFEATVAARVGGGDPCDLVGRHCESGDTLIRDVPLRDPRPGDVIAVPVTGAYCYSLSNNYNGARRPPVVFCANGTAHEVVRRETYEDLLRRDVDVRTDRVNVRAAREA
ncbi:diaminopimelate decarboxylase [Streptomyces sp. NPDC047117]|uniref:diaminopimelate decarboxylase n=1 Tax=Streptomyces sp. NPDC047117 TaxID=3155379 RepID=UPI0033EB705A